MKQNALFLTIAMSLLLAPLAFGQTKNVRPAEYLPVVKFDAARDADVDLKDAVAEATRVGKRIILDVGGEWCVWCHRLDKFLHDTKEIDEVIQKHFIILKINWSKENKNEKFLSAYPAIKGYPHLFVLDKDGKFLHSQDTGDLEHEKSYDKEKVLTFLNQWVLKK